MRKVGSLLPTGLDSCIFLIGVPIKNMKIPYIHWSSQCSEKVARKLRVTSVRAAHSRLHGLRAKSAHALKPADAFVPRAVKQVRKWPRSLLERFPFLRDGSST